MNQTVKESSPSLKMYHSSIPCNLLLYWGCCQWTNWYLSLFCDGFLSLCGCWLLDCYKKKKKRVFALCFGGADTQTWCLPLKISEKILPLDFMIWFYCVHFAIYPSEETQKLIQKCSFSVLLGGFLLPVSHEPFYTKGADVTSRVECLSLNLWIRPKLFKSLSVLDCEWVDWPDICPLWLCGLAVQFGSFPISANPRVSLLCVCVCLLVSCLACFEITQFDTLSWCHAPPPQAII